MANQLLVSVASVTVPAGGSVVVTHGLTSGGNAVAPTLVFPNSVTPLVVILVTATTYTVSNGTAGPLSATFRSERGHSPEVDAATLPTMFWQGGSSGSAPTPPATALALGTVQLTGGLGGAGTLATLPKLDMDHAAGGTLAIARGGTALASAGGTANRAVYTADGATFTIGPLPNAALANASVTVTAGTGLSGGGTVALGGTITLNAAAPAGGNAASGTLRVVTGTDSWSASDYALLVQPATATSFTLTLLSAVTAGSGRIFVLKHSGTGTITVASAAGTIDGAATLSVSTQYAAYTFISDGANWHII